MKRDVCRQMLQVYCMSFYTFFAVNEALQFEVFTMEMKWKKMLKKYSTIYFSCI